MRRGLAVASFEAFEMGTKAVVRRGLAIAALVAFNVAAAASVMAVTVLSVVKLQL